MKTLVARFNEQLNRTVPFKRNTEYFYSMSRGEVKINTFSGITISDPSTHSLASKRRNSMVCSYSLGTRDKIRKSLNKNRIENSNFNQCYKTYYFSWIICRFSKCPYLCNVFFIVLDLRLTKVEQGLLLFLCPYLISSANFIL